jgi:MFS family permease
MKSIRLHYAWVLVIISVFILAAVGFTFYPFGVFLKPITAELGWDRGALSGALSLAIILGGVIGILSGRLSDRFGPRPTITFGGILCGVAFLLLSLINSLWQVYLILGVMLGIGSAFCLVPIMPIIPRWFIKRRGIAMGIVMSGFGIGGIFTPLLTQWFISAWGWRWALIILGILIIVIIVPLAQFLKHSPQQAGLQPYGGDETNSGITGDKPSQSSALDGLSMRQAFRTRGFWLFGIIQIGALFCLVTVMIHIVAHATDIGIPEVKAASILSTVAAISIGGRLVVGFLSDRIGGRLVLTICLSLITLALIWLLFAKELWMFYVFAAILGIANGGFTTLIPIISTELFGLVSLGVIIGALGIFMTLGEAIGAPLSGAIFDITGSYRLAFIIGIGVCAVSIILSLVLLRNKGKTDMAR